MWEQASILGDPWLIGGSGAVLCASIAIGLVLYHVMVPPSDGVRDRITRAVEPAAGPSDIQRPNSLLSKQSREGFASSAMARLLRLLSRLSRPDSDEELSRTRARLDHAGLRTEHAVEIYFGAKIGLAVLLGGLMLLVAALVRSPIPHVTEISVALLAAGFYAPNLWLSSRIQERQLALARTLPDALDLLVTCVEAGLSVEQALARVLEEIGLSAPVLAQELATTMGEMRAGVMRGEAFRRLSARTGVEDLRQLAAMLVQTEMFGTSIAKALRIQADGMRIARTRKAEERAATVATKMLLPLIFCILPSLFAVIMGPAAVRIIRTLLPSLGGH